MLIGALLLYIIICNKNWCMCVMYVILCLMDFIQTVMSVGNYLTHNKDIENGVEILLFFALVKLPFYVITMFYCFLTYRELKALFLEVRDNENQQAMQMMNRNREEEEEEEEARR